MLCFARGEPYAEDVSGGGTGDPVGLRAGPGATRSAGADEPPQRMIDALFGRLDGNGDGSVSDDERRSGMERMRKDK